MAGYAPAPSAVIRRLDDHIIALNLDSGEYFTMNEVASRMWAVLTESGSFEETVTAIAAEYETSRAQVEQDLAGLIAELEASELLVVD